MDTVRNWACWIIAAGILLSPVFAFLLAVAIEISIGVLLQGGLSALLVLAAMVISGWLMFRKHRTRPQASNPVADQA